MGFSFFLKLSPWLLLSKLRHSGCPNVVWVYVHWWSLPVTKLSFILLSGPGSGALHAKALRALIKLQLAELPGVEMGDARTRGLVAPLGLCGTGRWGGGSALLLCTPATGSIKLNLASSVCVRSFCAWFFSKLGCAACKPDLSPRVGRTLCWVGRTNNKQW